MKKLHVPTKTEEIIGCLIERISNATECFLLCKQRYVTLLCQNKNTENYLLILENLTNNEMSSSTESFYIIINTSNGMKFHTFMKLILHEIMCLS